MPLFAVGLLAAPAALSASSSRLIPEREWRLAAELHRSRVRRLLSPGFAPAPPPALTKRGEPSARMAGAADGFRKLDAAHPVFNFPRRSGTELEATFSSLQLMHTSRTSGNRLFHLVVSVAVQGSQGPQQPLASISSPAFHVDARKRSQVERPDSSTSDVRLVARSECKRLKPQ